MTSSFEAMEARIRLLRQQIASTESQLQTLKAQLEKAERDVEETSAREASSTIDQDSLLPELEEDSASPYSLLMHQPGLYDLSSVPPSQRARGTRTLLDKTDYRRYSRQLILPEIGLPGQMNLKNSSVLIVGVGGLGCPAAAYLAGAGVGTVGLMDGDTVEVSNLHRQILHTTGRVGMMKVDSAYEYIRSLNPTLRNFARMRYHLTPSKAIRDFKDYDIILDCTDHPTSRYLISDACVLTGKPLISASALKTEGQLIVLNNPPQPPGDTAGGPCYRCIFPKPPPAETVLSCGEGGILGPVVGVMGVMQALEAIKLLTKKAASSKELSMANGSKGDEPPKPSMLMFSAYNNPQFRTVRLRSRRTDCAVCSSKATITKESLTSGSLDYVAFCGVATPANILSPHLRISASDFAKLPRDHILIDTRDETQYAICSLRDSINIPWTGSAHTWLARAQDAGVLQEDDESRKKYVVCRFGNDSQLAAKAIMDHYRDSKAKAIEVRDIRGGFEAWRKEVDPEWPDY